MAKHKIDPFDIFVQGHKFFHTHELIFRHFPKDEVLAAAAPCTVLAAFAIELLIKCIVCIETGYPPRGHHLAYLYKQISPESRKRIEELWDEYAKEKAMVWDNMEKVTGLPIARDLPAAIEKGSQAFERLRYRYEPKEDPCHFYLDDLPWMLGNQILNLRPDFENRSILPAPGATLLHWPDDWPPTDQDATKEREQFVGWKSFIQSVVNIASKIFHR